MSKNMPTFLKYHIGTIAQEKILLWTNDFRQIFGFALFKKMVSVENKSLAFD